MANKTQKNAMSVTDFLDSVEHEQKRTDSYAVLEIMKEITGEEPAMWGGSLVGFGSYHYKYESGREGDFFVTGFSPRKANLTLYIMSGFSEYDDLMSKLGKYKIGKSCLYVKKLEDVDIPTLKTLIQKSVDFIAQKYPA